jgi:hypothetical protein
MATHLGWPRPRSTGAITRPPSPEIASSAQTPGMPRRRGNAAATRQRPGCCFAREKRHCLDRLGTARSPGA